MSDYICPYTCSYRTNSGYCGLTGGAENCQMRKFLGYNSETRQFIVEPVAAGNIIVKSLQTNYDRSRSVTDRVICGECVEAMSKLQSESVDLVVTSPPYDALRKYNGYSFDLHKTGEQIYRVLKQGGICAMVIQDQTVNYGKTLTSFRTIVDWCDSFGFKLFETVIYHKNGTEGAWWKNRFRVDHEYIPIFLKGDKPAYFNKEPLKIPSKHGGKTMSGSGNRKTNGQTGETVRREINAMKCRGTVWDYMMAGDKDPLKRKHPAVFPDKIPEDLITCFCPPNGIVLDPYIGCGSTAVAAIRTGRHYIGLDISQEYVDLAGERIRKEKQRAEHTDREERKHGSTG